MIERLESIPQTEELKGKRVIITGCGFRPAETAFHDLITGEETHDSLFVDGTEMKVNIGASVAFVLAAKGATVHMVDITERPKTVKEKMKELLGVPDERIEYSKVDLLDTEQVEEFVAGLPRDKPLWWVQTIGLSAGAYEVEDDNPYLHIEDIPDKLLEKESEIVLKGTHILMKEMLPLFREQNEEFDTASKVAIVTSMSAIRGYDLGGTHCAAKGAIDRYTNSAMLDLIHDDIFISTVRPGAVDTGMYDGEPVIDVVRHVGENYGFSYEGKEIPLSPPIAVGEAVFSIFTSPAHITSVNLVANKQFPNEAS